MKYKSSKLNSFIIFFKYQNVLLGYHLESYDTGNVKSFFSSTSSYLKCVHIFKSMPYADISKKQS